MELPEDPIALREVLKKGLSHEVPELDWTTRKSPLFCWANGYKSKTFLGRLLEGAKVELAVSRDRRNGAVLINNPDYVEHGKRIKYAIDKGMFEPSPKVVLVRRY